MLRLPRQAAAAETRLIVTAVDGGERWERTIGGRCFDTRQFLTNESELAERFGILELRFNLRERDGSLHFDQHEAALVIGPVRLRIPAGCAPRVQAREDPAGRDRLKVDVRIDLPVFGLLIAYDGAIEIEDSRS